MKWFKNLFKKYKKKERVYKVKITPKIKFLFEIGSVHTISKDKKYYLFSIDLTDKEDKEFRKSCKFCSKLDKVPLYTFRCGVCEKVYLITDSAYGAIFTPKGIKNICKRCQRTQNTVQ